MKKLSLIFIALLFSYISFAQDTNREMSNYEKYVIQMQDDQAKSAIQQIEKAQKDQDTLKMTKKEWDDLYYTKADAKAERKAKRQRKSYVDPVQAFVDTLKQDNPNVEVNVYDLDPFYYSDRIGRFYYGGFNRWQYSYPWYYNSWMYDDYGWNWNPYYGFNYPYYNDFYFGFGYTTFGHYWRPFPDFGGGYGWGYSNWSPWRHEGNQWNNYYGNHNGGGFRNYNHMNPTHYQTQTLTNINRHNSVAPQGRASYSTAGRSYTPSYNTPRMSTRPQYNNSKVNTSNLFGRRANANTQTNTQTRTSQPNTQTRTYSQPNTQRSIAPNNQRSSQSRSYSVPSRSYNNSSSRSNSNYNSGSSGRSSSYSSGSSNYSSGSSGGGGRSSGGSSGGGRSSGGSSGRR